MINGTEIEYNKIGEKKIWNKTMIFIIVVHVCLGILGILVTYIGFKNASDLCMNLEDSANPMLWMAASGIILIALPFIMLISVIALHKQIVDIKDRLISISYINAIIISLFTMMYTYYNIKFTDIGVMNNCVNEEFFIYWSIFTIITFIIGGLSILIICIAACFTGGSC